MTDYQPNKQFSRPSPNSPDDIQSGQVWTLESIDDPSTQQIAVILDKNDAGLILAPIAVQFDKMHRDYGDFYVDETNNTSLNYSCYVQTWCQFRASRERLVNYFGSLQTDELLSARSPRSIKSGVDHIDRYRSKRRQTIDSEWDEGRSMAAGTDVLTDDQLKDVAGGYEDEPSENGDLD